MEVVYLDPNIKDTCGGCGEVFFGNPESVARQLLKHKCRGEPQGILLQNIKARRSTHRRGQLSWESMLN